MALSRFSGFYFPLGASQRAVNTQLASFISERPNKFIHCVENTVFLSARKPSDSQTKIVYLYSDNSTAENSSVNKCHT